MFRGAGIALRTQLATLRAARAHRILFYVVVALLVVLVGGYLAGWLNEQTLRLLRGLVLLPGIPIAAVLVAEIPVRDGIGHRTLLYLLLGPVSRPALVTVRTIVAALVVALGASLLVLALGLVGGASFSDLLREMLAVLLASLAYTAMFGVLHMHTRRGLVAGLVLYAVLDAPLGRLPFALRNIAPSAHVSTVAGHSVQSDIPLPLPVHETPLGVAVGVLLAIFIVGTLVSALRFARKDLGELC